MNSHLIRAVKLYVHDLCTLCLEQAAWELTVVNARKNPNNAVGNGIRAALAESLQACAIVERPLPH